MDSRAQFQISRVGASLFSGGAVYVLMALYPELPVCSCRIIDSQPVLAKGQQKYVKKKSYLSPDPVKRTVLE